MQAGSKNEIKCKNRAGGKASVPSVGQQPGRTYADLCNAKLSVHARPSLRPSVRASRPVGHPVSQLTVSSLPVALPVAHPLSSNRSALRSCFILHSHSPSLFTCRIFAAHQINKHTHAYTRGTTFTLPHTHTHSAHGKKETQTKRSPVFPVMKTLEIFLLQDVKRKTPINKSCA